MPQEIQVLYNSERTLHDGEWMPIHVDGLDMLEAVKKMILIKKHPNRKAFPQTHLRGGNCGNRCDFMCSLQGGSGHGCRGYQPICGGCC